MQRRDEFKIVPRIASTVALGGFLVGFDATVISGAVPFDRDYWSRSRLAPPAASNSAGR